MNFNIDSAIFIGFLIANLVIGLGYSRHITSIREYAIGNRNFSTATISATIIATWIAGSSLTIKVSETYNHGLYFIAANVVDPLCFVIVGYFFAPRMGEFLGKLSVAEAMGELYGNTVRFITVISAVGISVGYIGLQIKVMSTLLDYFFGIGSLPAVLITVFVTVLYSAMGGIKAVTFTDTLQLFTFGVFIPGLALIIWGTMHDPSVVSHSLSTNKLFDYREFFSLNNPNFFSWLVLFLYCLIPALDPAIFQRIAMSTNTKQVRRSFLVAACFILILSLIMYFMGILLLSANSSLNTSNMVGYIIDNYSYTGLKSLTIIGILAMAMSTADSYINSSAVLLAHDLPQSLGIKISDKNQLLLSRIASVIIGTFALIPALLAKNLLQMLLIMANFYMPVVSVPLILAIFGFRSTTKAVLIGMVSGIVTVIIFNYLNVGVDSVIPGMIANLIGFIGSHYLLKQPGGWVGIKDKQPLMQLRFERRQKLQAFIAYIRNFNFMQACKNNAPKSDSVYSLFGLFCIVSVFSTLYSIPKEIQQSHIEMLDMIYHTILFSSTILLSYPIWPPTFKNEKFIVVFWNIAVPYILVFVPTLLIIVSNFGQFQLMILIINMIIISLLLRWKVAVLTIFSALTLGIQFYKWLYGVEDITTNLNIALQLKIMYLLLLFSSILLVFLKPKQEEHELVEEKVEHLGIRIGDREEELQKLLELKSEFLRNLEHEVRTPITGITSMAETLYDSCEKMDPKKLKEYLGIIATSSERFNTYSRNILDLSKLSSLTYELNKTNVNLSELVIERLDRCKRLYLNNKGLEFVTKVQPSIQLNCDQHYIASTIDNLIINAISYSKAGKITITLEKIDNNVEFSITDEGIGIPQSELYDIFGAFVVSSKTRTPAGGRGVGTALCKKVIEVHQGKIWAESDGEKGATFRFILPLSV